MTIWAPTWTSCSWHDMYTILSKNRGWPIRSVKAVFSNRTFRMDLLVNRFNRETLELVPKKRYFPISHPDVANWQFVFIIVNDLIWKYIIPDIVETIMKVNKITEKMIYGNNCAPMYVINGSNMWHFILSLFSSFDSSSIHISTAWLHISMLKSTRFIL